MISRTETGYVCMNAQGNYAYTTTTSGLGPLKNCLRYGPLADATVWHESHEWKRSVDTSLRGATEQEIVAILKVKRTVSLEFIK